MSPAAVVVRPTGLWTPETHNRQTTERTHTEFIAQQNTGRWNVGPPSSGRDEITDISGKYGLQTKRLSGANSPEVSGPLGQPKFPRCSAIFSGTGTETQHIPTLLFAKKTLVEKEIRVQRTVVLTATAPPCCRCSAVAGRSVSGCRCLSMVCFAGRWRSYNCRGRLFFARNGFCI